MEDLDGLGDGELLEQVRELVAEQNRLTARLAAAVRWVLCERHHTKIHHGYRVERQPHRWRTRRPDGTEILLSGPSGTWDLAG